MAQNIPNYPAWEYHSNCWLCSMKKTLESTLSTENFGSTSMCIHWSNRLFINHNSIHSVYPCLNIRYLSINFKEMLRLETNRDDTVRLFQLLNNGNQHNVTTNHSLPLVTMGGLSQVWIFSSETTAQSGWLSLALPELYQKVSYFRTGCFRTHYSICIKNLDLYLKHGICQNVLQDGS